MMELSELFLMCWAMGATSVAVWYGAKLGAMRAHLMRTTKFLYMLSLKKVEPVDNKDGTFTFEDDEAQIVIGRRR